jgi:prophage DNA circulation protein
MTSVLGIALSSWFQNLQPASYNGVPFAVLNAEGEAGRRQALHQYPKRDTPWPEDMGRKARGFQITGFLVGDDVIQQRAKMLAAVETPGPGQLIHATRGLIKVALMGFRDIERWDRGRYFELQFSFVEAGQKNFPTTVTATQPAVLNAAIAADTAASSDFVAIAAQTLIKGAQVAVMAANTVAPWAQSTQSLGADATNLTNMVSSLTGNYGRYFNGNNSGPFGNNANPVVNSTDTAADLILAGSQAQLNINNATAAVTAAGAQLSASTSAAFVSVIQALAAALLAAAVNPADALRLLMSLADFTPSAPTPASQLGDAMATMQSATGNICRRTAVIALARAAQNYQPSSYNDAANVRTQVCALIDNEVTVAGDNGEDATLGALRSLRAAVIEDLTARGADLAQIETFTFKASLPALTLAQRLYRDPSRGDELVTQADPPHPSFMPVSFQALAA